MRIKKLVVNKNKRQVASKNELKQIFLKFFFTWLNIKKKIFLGIRAVVSKLLFLKSNNQAYFTAIKNICLISGRTKSVVRMYKISRIKFNEFMFFGKLPGWKKSSW